jgi:hypothetical protein
MAAAEPQIPVSRRPRAAAQPAIAARARRSAAALRGDPHRGPGLHLPAGMALSEQAVSEQLQVSRAPGARSFPPLAVEGLLEVVPQRGTSSRASTAPRSPTPSSCAKSIECQARRARGAAPLPAQAARRRSCRRRPRRRRASDYTTHLSADEEFHHPSWCWPAIRTPGTRLRLARTGMNRIRHLAIPTWAAPHRDRPPPPDRQCPSSAATRAAASDMRVHIHSPLGFPRCDPPAVSEYFE